MKRLVGLGWRWAAVKILDSITVHRNKYEKSFETNQPIPFMNNKTHSTYWILWICIENTYKYKLIDVKYRSNSPLNIETRIWVDNAINMSAVYLTHKTIVNSVTKQ